jgi:hypothetical protein
MRSIRRFRQDDNGEHNGDYMWGTGVMVCVGIPEYGPCCIACYQYCQDGGKPAHESSTLSSPCKLPFDCTGPGTSRQLVM